jgi:hypothetical protein
MKLPYYLSTREAVAEWIEQKFGIWLSIWTGVAIWRGPGISATYPSKLALHRIRDVGFYRGLPGRVMMG